MTDPPLLTAVQNPPASPTVEFFVEGNVTDIVDSQLDGMMERFIQARREDERAFILLEIFAQCGFQVRQPHRLGDRLEVDGEITATIDGQALRYVIELKQRAFADSIASAIRHVQRVRHDGNYDRALIIVPGDVPEALKQQAESDGLGYMDLLGGPELRSWLSKNRPINLTRDDSEQRTCALIIRGAMRELAERLAKAPEELWQIEWRDLERVLREVFEAMGFETTLIRSAKDGGFDLSLEVERADGKHLYLVEVKHWTTKTPGNAELKKLVRVTARECARRGVLLSSSGFSSSIFQGITEIERRTVGIGSNEKIVALCQTYYRLGTQLWTAENDSVELLLSGLR